MWRFASLHNGLSERSIARILRVLHVGNHLAFRAVADSVISNHVVTLDELWLCL